MRATTLPSVRGRLSSLATSPSNLRRRDSTVASKSGRSADRAIMFGVLISCLKNPTAETRMSPGEVSAGRGSAGAVTPINAWPTLGKWVKGCDQQSLSFESDRHIARQGFLQRCNC
jgi:hypothetical protein